MKDAANTGSAVNAVIDMTFRRIALNMAGVYAIQAPLSVKRMLKNFVVFVVGLNTGRCAGHAPNSPVPARFRRCL